MYKPTKSSIAEMLGSAQYGDNGDVTIINRDGELVAATNSNVDLINLIDLDQLDGASNYYKQVVDGVEYIYQVVTSDYSGCSFISIVPTSIFWAKLHTIRSYSIFATCIYLLLGILISFLLSGRNYAPISTLIQDITKKSKEILPTASRNEIDYIRDVMNTVLSEQEQYAKIRQSEFLFRALHGIHPKNKDIFSEFKMAGIELLSDCFIIVIFHIDSWDSKAVSENYRYNQILLMESIIKNTLDCHCSENHQTMIISNARNTCIGIFNLSDKHPENISEICENLQDILEADMEIICTAAFSSECRGWSGLEKALKEAEEAMEYRTIYGSGSLLSYKELENESKSHYNFDSRGSAERLIYLYIMNGEPSPEELIQQIKEESCSGGIHLPEEYKCYFYDMNNLLSKVTEKLGFGEEEIYDLSFCETLPQLNARLIKTLSSLRKLYMAQIPQQGDLAKEKELCDQVIAFIKDNYTNSNLSAAEIGENFNLTAPYLSRRFKEFSGISISSFLTNVRIEKAKDLLTQTEDNIEKIAEVVGFTSSATLIRTFKKLEDITPGSYRKIYKK